MRPTLFIRLPEAAEDPVAWLIRDGGEENEMAAAEHARLEDISLHAPGRRVVVLAPAARILLTQTRIPSRNRQRILNALPYALEDQLAEEVERLHFALGQREADGTLQVAVVARRCLADWIARLRACDIEPDALVPDLLCLPWEAGHWSALEERHQTLIRTSLQAGLAADNENLETMLRLMLAEHTEEGRPATIRWYQAPGAEDPPFTAVDGVNLLPHHLEENPLGLLAGAYDPTRSIDLLQGEFSRHERLGRLWRPWRATAALLLVLLAVSAAGTAADYWRLQRERAQLQQHIERIYLDTFPEARRVVDARVQMERRLAALRSGGSGTQGGFLELLRRVGPALKAVQAVELRRLAYREGRLDLALRVRDLQHLDRLKQRLGEAQGLEVEIQSASARDDRVEARLSIRPRQGAGKGGV